MVSTKSCNSLPGKFVANSCEDGQGPNSDLCVEGLAEMALGLWISTCRCALTARYMVRLHSQDFLNRYSRCLHISGLCILC